jgi:hypothetical protein
MEKLNSVLKSQPLRLALKVLILSAGAYFARNGNGPVTAAFIAIAAWLYFSPAVNLGRFWFSYGVNLAFLFFAPWDRISQSAQIFVALGFGIAAGLILGAKNMIFMKRLASYQMAICLLLGELTYFFFSGALGAAAPFASFIGFALLTREYYAAASDRPMAFYAVVSAAVYSQFLWAVSVVPILNSGKIALSLTLILLMNDIFAHQLGGNLSRRIIWRNAAVAATSSILIISLSSGHLG